MILAWTLFVAFVLAMLALDLGVFHRHAHAVSVREAIRWSAVWITLGLLFSVVVYFGYEYGWSGLGATIDAVDGERNTGLTAAEKYLTGYVVEKSLSVDNIFVIALIFRSFGVPAIYQHRVLFWGVLGALVMRGAMIGVGAAMIARFHWILYIFAVFLILTGLRLLFSSDDHGDPAQNRLVRWVRKAFPITARYHGEHFLVRAGTKASHEAAVPGAEVVDDPVVDAAKPGTWLLTPLALALVMVETTDLIFAVDSIPAIFAITADPFLVFTSNVFAILGLRSLYFALAGMVDAFRYLKASLAVILLLVGSKMLAAEQLKDLLGKSFNLWLLLLIVGILAVGVIASVLADRRDARRQG